MIHLSCVHQTCNNYNDLLQIEENIQIEFWFALFICPLFNDHVINPKSFLEIDQNI